MRQLKHHEKKLLKKVDFVQWKSDATLHEAQVMRRYAVTNRDDYRHYSKLVGNITKLAAMMKKLPQNDEFRITTTEQMLHKLYTAGESDGDGTAADGGWAPSAPPPPPPPPPPEYNPALPTTTTTTATRVLPPPPHLYYHHHQA
jgi:hypothetical protein